MLRWCAKVGPASRCPHITPCPCSSFRASWGGPALDAADRPDVLDASTPSPNPAWWLESGTVPTFSVVVAAYQAANTIGRAIDSALAQTYPPFEVIVCDDGSTDNLAAALARYGDSVTVIRQENQGVSAAKNTAAFAARGEWLVLLDADDEWLPTRLEKIGRVIVQNEMADIVTTDAIVRSPGRPESTWYRFREWPGQLAEQPTAIVAENFIFGGAAIRRDVFNKIGGFRTGLPQDSEYEAWVRIILGGGRAALVPEPLAIYHVEGEGNFSRNRTATYRTILFVLDDVEGKYGPAVDSAIEERRRSVTSALAVAEGVEAVRRRSRRGALAAATNRAMPAQMRARFALAAVAPSLAARRL